MILGAWAQPRWPCAIAAATAAIAALSQSAAGQVPNPDIVLDGSLGSLDPVPVSVDGGGGRHYQIPDTLGAFSANGENLFHSFQRFGVPGDGSATFLSAATPERVVEEKWFFSEFS